MILASGLSSRFIAIGWVLSASAWTATLHAQPVDATEGAVRILRRAVHIQRDGSHLPLLFALRPLRDPDLKPVFLRMVGQDDWQVQVHAVRGLAETDPTKHVDPALIRQLKPHAQEAVIATGLDLELIGK